MVNRSRHQTSPILPATGSPGWIASVAAVEPSEHATKFFSVASRLGWDGWLILLETKRIFNKLKKMFIENNWKSIFYQNSSRVLIFLNVSGKNNDNKNKSNMNAHPVVDARNQQIPETLRQKTTRKLDMSIVWSDFFQQWNLKIHILSSHPPWDQRTHWYRWWWDFSTDLGASPERMGEQQKVMETQSFFGNPKTSTIVKTSGFWSSQNSGRNIWKVVARQFWLPIPDNGLCCY